MSRAYLHFMQLSCGNGHQL